jgi:uncharacterized protein (TIGR00251 family)
VTGEPVSCVHPPWGRYDPAVDVLTLELHVQPGASRTMLAGMHGDRLKLRLAARPVEGEANRALVRFLADALAVTQRDVEIVRGESGRSKTVKVRGAGPGAAARLASGDAA